MAVWASSPAARLGLFYRAAFGTHLMTELYRLGLRDAALRIRSGKLTSVDYTRDLVARIDALEEDVQAWQWLDRGRALELAARADKADNALRVAHPLHGVPIGVKDLFYTAGIPTEMGCRAYVGYVPRLRPMW